MSDDKLIIYNLDGTKTEVDHPFLAMQLDDLQKARSETGNELLNDCQWFANKHRGKYIKSGPHWSTIIRFTPLFDEAVRLQKRVDTLEAHIADYCSETIQEKYIENAQLQAEIERLRDGKAGK